MLPPTDPPALPWKGVPRPPSKKLENCNLKKIKNNNKRIVWWGFRFGDGPGWAASPPPNLRLAQRQRTARPPPKAVPAARPAGDGRPPPAMAGADPKACVTPSAAPVACRLGRETPPTHPLPPLVGLPDQGVIRTLSGPVPRGLVKRRPGPDAVGHPQVAEAFGKALQAYQRGIQRDEKSPEIEQSSAHFVDFKEPAGPGVGVLYPGLGSV